jgi:hypothetical protein
VTWDHIYDFADHERPAAQVLVVSAPSPRFWGDPVCRLLHLGESTGRKAVRHAPRVSIETVTAERPERALSSERMTVPLDVQPPSRPGCISIDAQTADAAYEKLVYALDAHRGPLNNVTCVVRDPESAKAPPTNFSVGNDHPNTQQWFDDAVEWWQHVAPSLVASGNAPFNHGARIRSGGSGPGWLYEAAEVLGSTKALVLLTNNEELRSGAPVPAFVSVQLVVAIDEEGPRLDCVGYFRKQDLTLWWPVNIAELRSIQEYVLDLELDAVQKVRAGHLVTIAAEAIRDNVLPELAGAAVDRSVDLRPDDLMRMAYRVAHGPFAERDDINAHWARVLRDIGDDKAFPSLGLRVVIEHLEVFRDVGGKGQVGAVIKALENLYDRSDRAERRCQTRSERAEFSQQLFGLTADVLEAVDLAIGTLEGPATSPGSGGSA